MTNFSMPSIPVSRIPRPNFKRISFDKKAILAVLAYINILIVIPMIVGRKNEFVAYHIRQGYLLLAVFVVGLFSFFIPVLPWLFAIYFVVSFILGIVYSISGKEKPIPFIGKFAEKY